MKNHINMELFNFKYHTLMAEQSMPFKDFKKWCYNHWTLVFFPNGHWDSFLMWNRSCRPVRNSQGKIDFLADPLKSEQAKGFPHMDEFLKYMKREYL